MGKEDYKEANELCKNTDADDMPFVAFSKYLRACWEFVFEPIADNPEDSGLF